MFTSTPAFRGSTPSIGPFTPPSGFIGTLIVLLLIVVIGQVLLGLAWWLVLIALAVVIGVWLRGLIGTRVELI